LLGRPAMVSVSLCRATVIMYRAGLGKARCGGRAFMSGTDVPTADVT
jgi:hypothetical protein